MHLVGSRIWGGVKLAQNGPPFVPQTKRIIYLDAILNSAALSQTLNS